MEGLCCGDPDIVVAAVVAVRGLSAELIAAADDEGSLPVSSSLRILDFRSSNSSQTVEGAVVEIVDSVATCSSVLDLIMCAGSDTSLVLLNA